MATLLLELSYGLKHKQNDRSDVKKSVEKMFGWLDAMRHTDDIVDRAYKVVIKILQQHKFRTMFSEILGECNPTHEQTHHVPSNPGHTHPRPTEYPPNGDSSQVPTSEWYSGPYAANTQPEGDITYRAMTNPQPETSFGSSQGQQPFPQMAQISPQAEQYQYFEHPYNNQFMFSNPFMTSYDQSAPFSLSPQDMWPRLGSSGDGGFAGQQGAHGHFPFTMGQDASGGSQRSQ